MSSSPPPDASPKRWPTRWLTPLSLRTRLIVAIVALIAVVCGIIGLVTTVAMRGFLVDQLDAQLRAAGNRSQQGAKQPPPPRGDPHGGPQFLLAPGQAAGTL